VVAAELPLASATLVAVAVAEAVMSSLRLASFTTLGQLRPRVATAQTGLELTPEAVEAAVAAWFSLSLITTETLEAFRLPVDLVELESARAKTAERAWPVKSFCRSADAAKFRSKVVK